MDLHSIRQQLKTKSVYDIPLRVTYYARVSSESDEQLNSLGNQIGYLRGFQGYKGRFKGDDRRVREDVFRHDVRPKNR